MKSKRILVALAAIAILLPLAGLSLHAAETKVPPATAPNPEVIVLRMHLEEMQAKVDTLEAKVARLQGKVTAVEKENAQQRLLLQTPLQWGSVTAPPTTGPAYRLTVPTDGPRGSVRREFNGDYYYLVPLNSSTAAR